MSQVVYNSIKENIVKAEYNEEINCLIAKWYTMIAFEDLEPCYRAMAKTLQQFKPPCVIMDTSEAKNTIRTDDLEWIDTFYFTRAVHYGAKDLIVIPPTSAITKEAMKDYMDTAEKQGIKIHIVENYNDALIKAKAISEANQ